MTEKGMIKTSGEKAMFPLGIPTNFIILQLKGFSLLKQIN
jgi:hypothetical protein